MNNVFEIYKLAKIDPGQAERAILKFVRKIIPQLKARSIKITDSKISLNSLNGYMLADRQKYFFKFHTEENEQATANLEYYNAKLLADQGLPVIIPLYAKTEPDSQFVVYPYISYSTAFDEYEKEELKFFGTGAYNKPHLGTLLAADSALLAQIQKIYLLSLALNKSQAIKDAALYQLFYRRLVGTRATKPRLDLYYKSKDVILPDGTTMAFNELANLRWIINGIHYDETLEQIIEKAKVLLNPLNETYIPTVIGHGDDHNGNKFFTGNEFVCFDPAFAGRQPALLSFIKPTAHNVFVHPFWLYDPKRLNSSLKMRFKITEDIVTINHNWDLKQRSPLRLHILRLYEQIIWRPLLQELKNRGWLQSDWREYIRKALFCCPFLVTNLINPIKYTPEQSLLALSMCVMLGSEGSQKTIIDKFITNINPS